MKFFIKTFGCQMNVNDSEKMDHILQKKGMVRTDDVTKADLIVINSCAVREKAQEKIFSYIGRLEPDQKIIVAGCVAQSEKNLILKRNGKINFVLGTHQFYEINDILEQEIKKNVRGARTEFRKEWLEAVPDIYSRGNGYTGYISIMEGCNNFCTYCIVPFTRGREKYRPFENIVNEAKYLAKSGFKEIILIGQNVNSWRDSDKNISFSLLLEHVSQIKGIKWIRFITSYPGYYESELIETMKRNRKIARHIHFPAQSGSTVILKKMGRVYSRKEYLDIISRFKKEIPEIRFSSDFIVGFPGETEKDFNLTLSLIEKVKYDSIFSFIYSPRKYTKAAQLIDAVSPEEKKDRLRRLQELQKKIQLETHRKMVGTEVEVMITGENKKRPDEMLGRTESYKVVNFKSKGIPGDFVRVKIERIGPYSLRGTEVQR